MKYTEAYVPPTLTVDAVLFQLVQNRLEVILIERPNDPFKGSWALPGGYNAVGEITLHALQRIVSEKAGIDLAKDLSYVEQLYTFDTVARDPRGHAVSVTYLGCGREIKPVFAEAKTQSFPVAHLPQLAYDHHEIINYAHQRLIAKLMYTNAIYAFLPGKFSLSELQAAYEAILGHELDKRNFRKKFLSLGLIHETEEMKREGAHRPARLYKFNSTKLEVLSRSFD
ncbi:NUDIX hydrolase [Candidatus Saccharibacteria bacterium]|nr:NUDIX hydrolase [Candidatus Saccharibacteria bacterium]